MGAVIALVIAVNNDVAFRAWLRRDPNRLLSWFEWAAALVLAAKFWLAAFAWRNISRQRVRQYLLAWCGGVLCLLALGWILWADGMLTMALMAVVDFLPLDPIRLRNLLVLVALLVIPLARLGLAPASLAKNRHG
jgi:hypothetical protein